MSDLQNSPQTICCIGEVLWDALPEGLFLGGAPLNVCYHLDKLGESARIVSCIGRDRLGHEVLRVLKGRGVSVDYLQEDGKVETGFVEVNIIENEGPGYEIIEPAAWDFISFTEGVQALTEDADIIVFGTLGQRNKVSRKTIQQVIKQNVFTIYDINLRPPYDDPSIVEASLRETNIAKMNDEELMVLADWFGYPKQTEKAIEKLAEAFGCQQVCITCGKDGSVLYNKNTWVRQESFSVEVIDTVGSGDAFLAAFIFGMSHFKTDQERLRFASLFGAFMATKKGACPPYPLKEIENFASKTGISINLT